MKSMKGRLSFSALVTRNSKGKMEKEVAVVRKAHIVVLPYHGQGHMNPLLQFSKRLATKGIKVTVTTTLSNTKAMQAAAYTCESIYDDFSEGGSAGPGGFKGFLERFEVIGSRNLTSLLRKFGDSGNPVACLLYDASITWASNVVNKIGIRSAAFVTHSCAFFASLYSMHCDLLGIVPSVNPILSMPGLMPELRVPAMPSLGSQTGRYPPIIQFLLRQFDNIEKADWLLFNSFHMLEEEVVNWMLKLWPGRLVGPILPLFYLDNHVEVDNSHGYGFKLNTDDICMKWLDSKDTKSIIYVSFGTVSSLSKEQTAELAEALVNSGKSFLWVVRPSEEHTLPANFVEDNLNQGLIVKWCQQLAVLGHDSVGCFISHCGWNSTIEAISLGVPIVALPQFLDQITNAHFVEHIWQVGIQPKADDKGFCPSMEISKCIWEIMQGGGGGGGGGGEEIRNNVARLKQLAKEAVAEGGSSDRNINQIIHKLLSGD